MKGFLVNKLDHKKIFPLIIFLGAFLLFSVQPIISKFILPWFGGSSSVWTIALLFFQFFLLLGYAYAHFISFFKIKVQKIFFLIPLFAALLILPITPNIELYLNNNFGPTLQVLFLLLATIGLPYLVLAAASPLFQSWFSNFGTEGKTYRLYAWSNAGSLLGLLTYPVIVEPLFNLEQQTFLWSVLFLFFVVLIFFLIFSQKLTFDSVPQQVFQDNNVKPSISKKILWVILPALATLLLVSTTSYISQDIAAVPFLWVLPLSLYLLSFILTFKDNKFYDRQFFQKLFLVASLFSAFLITQGSGFSVILLLIVSLLMMFIFCLVCHGELYSLRPSPKYLTSFYLWISFGGALGGFFVAIIAPLIFPLYFEFHLGIGLIVLVFLLLWLKNKVWLVQLKSQKLKQGVLLLILFIVFISLSVNIKATLTEPTSISRNFYGVIRLFNLPDYKVIYDGHIMHGSQFTDEQKKCIPTTYYGETSGIGQVVHFFDKGKDIRLGVIGLGAGSVAGYADYVKFYELNPLVADVAKNNFFYLKDCTKEYDVVIGDGRLSLEKEELQNFDIFVLDAFSSDSIPVHLLTVEAFETYLKHINENGVIAVHISNFYIDLEPVIVGIANNFDLNIIITRDKGNGEKGSIGSSWAVLSKNQEIIESIKNNELEDIEIKTEFNKFILWTDKYSNLIRVLRIY